MKTKVPTSFAKTLAEATKKLTKDSDAVAEVKGQDYREGSRDLLANFRQSAVEAGLSPLQVWLVFFNKHRAAIANYIKTGGKSQSEPIHERFIDVFNYVRLGWLLMVEAEVERGLLDEVGRLPEDGEPPAFHFLGLGAEVETRDEPETPWVRSKFLKMFEGDQDHARDYGVSIRIEGRNEIYSSKDRHGAYLWRPVQPSTSPVSTEAKPISENVTAPPSGAALISLEELSSIVNRHGEMTEEEKEEQRRSFVYGNTKLANESVTRALVDEVAAQAPFDLVPGDEIEVKDDNSSDAWKKARLLRHSVANRGLYPFVDYGEFVMTESVPGLMNEVYSERDPDGNMLWRRIPRPPSPETK